MRIKTRVPKRRVRARNPRGRDQPQQQANAKSQGPHTTTTPNSNQPPHNLQPQPTNNTNQQLQQEYLQQQQSVLSEGEAYGDSFQWTKPAQTFRIILGNVNNLPKHQWQEKQRRFIKQSKKLQPDILGICEPGLNPTHLSYEDQWKQRIKRRARFHPPEPPTLPTPLSLLRLHWSQEEWPCLQPKRPPVESGKLLRIHTSWVAGLLS